MSRQTEITIVSLALICLLLFEIFYPTGIFYSYFHRRPEEKGENRKRKALIVPIPSALEPQLVGYSLSEYATGWITQRKVWVSYGSPEYFWVTYWYGWADYSDKLFLGTFDSGWEYLGTLDEWDNQEKGASSTLTVTNLDYHCNGTSMRAQTVAGENALVVKNFTEQETFDTLLYIRILTAPPTDKIGWFMLLYNETSLKIAVGFKTLATGKQWVYRYLNTSDQYETLFFNMTYSSTEWYGVKVHLDSTTQTSAFSVDGVELQNVTNYSADGVINKLKVGVNSTGSEEGAMQAYIDCVVADPNPVDFEPINQAGWMYTSSSDGITWRTPTRFIGNRRHWQYKPLMQMLDFWWHNGTNIASCSMPYGDGTYWLKATLSEDGTMTVQYWGAGLGYNYHKSGRHSKTQNEYLIFYSDVRPHFGYNQGDSIGHISTSWSGQGHREDGAIGSYTITTGGYSTLALNATHVLVLGKYSDNNLYYGISTAAVPTRTKIGITLANGFSTFCATSDYEASQYDESISGNAIHVVAIKNTGQLVYFYYKDGEWSSPIVVCETGATYPVIAVGKTRIYFFFVKENKIKLIYCDRATLSISNEIDLFPNHEYHNPVHLTTNQMAQNGKIILGWTEKNNQGANEPYSVWFSYIQDF